MKKIFPFKKSKKIQAGVTLIELMVSLAIGMVIVLAVAMAYLAVRTTATATNAISRINEDGKLALDMLAREIQMAGFYPATVTNTLTPNVRGSYVNIKNSGQAAYEQGIFGCSGSKFKPTTFTCGSAVTGESDSIILNYFSLSSKTDIGTDNISVSRDCINGGLENDPVNVSRYSADPKQPMFVSNRFAIDATSYSQASSGAGGNSTVKTISTGSLACNGNGVKIESTTYQPIFEGVAQMVIRYAVQDGSSGEIPQRFYSATQVTALPTIDSKNGWRRVSAVRVCLLMQSLTGGRNENAAGVVKKYIDCFGTEVTQPASDRNIYKTFTRLIAVRNQLTGVQ